MCVDNGILAPAADALAYTLTRTHMCRIRTTSGTSSHSKTTLLKPTADASAAPIHGGVSTKSLHYVMCCGATSKSSVTT